MKKIGFIAIAVVTVLATLGIGFSMWSQTVTVNGTVNTGKVSWSFYTASMLDSISLAATNGVYYPLDPSLCDYTTQNGFVGGYVHLDKNVSYGTSVISADGQTLTVTLNNTYPCNFNSLSFYVKNTGTLPIKVWRVQIFDNNGNVVSTYYSENDVPATGVALNLDGNAGNDFEIRYGDNFGLQIEPGQQSSGEMSIWFHTLQPAPQSSTLTFTIKLTAVQWNEYTAGPVAGS
jgi:hypothetical protein